MAARFAARGSLIPVIGNLFHHAIEMYLKAALIGTLSVTEMKNQPYSHNLVALWNRFKAKEAEPALSRFDLTVCVLHRFDAIRYPEEIVTKGMRVLLSWRPLAAGPPSDWALEPQNYGIWVADIDSLVVEVVHRVNPTFSSTWLKLHPEAREALKYDNPHSAAWQ